MRKKINKNLSINLNRYQALFIVTLLSTYISDNWSTLGLFNYRPLLNIYKKLENKFKFLESKLNKEDREALEDSTDIFKELENYYKERKKRDVITKRF